jgi:hypothetical protein
MIRRIFISSFEGFNLASVKFASSRASESNGPGGGWMKTEAVLCAYCRAQGQERDGEPTVAGTDRSVQHWAYSIPDPPNLVRLACRRPG